MKTMWFTFLYGNAIPIGIILSMVGLVCYYWVDKYNVMRRRTIKENLSKQVSIGMIELLEMTIIFCGIGNMTMSYQFFSCIRWQDIVVLIAGLIYAALPMQEINETLFPISGNYFNSYILQEKVKYKHMKLRVNILLLIMIVKIQSQKRRPGRIG